MKICQHDEVYRNFDGNYCYRDSYGEVTEFATAAELIAWIEKDIPLADDEKQAIDLLWINY